MSATGVASAQSAPAGADGSYGANGHGPIDFGPNVKIFDPSMSTSEIQATVDAIAAQQVGNQFGPERYSLLFKPGTYGSADCSAELPGRLLHQRRRAWACHPMTSSSTDPSMSATSATQTAALPSNNFWRSLSNLKINVTNPDFGCYTGEFWAVSQAAPMRRVHVTGQTTLMDYCTGPSFASGGFIADSQFDGQIISGSQQQWMTRNSVLERLVERCLEPGVLRHHGCPGRVLPGGGVVWRAVHDGADTAR